MIDAATEFAKSGYSPEDALQLGIIAAKYTNVADEIVSTSDAAGFIIAQMKAFNIEAKDSEHIIDAVNEVANRFAVSSADISENLGKSSSSLASTNTSFEESIGLLTAITEQTRNAATASVSLKTISARLRGLNDEGEELADLVPKLQSEFGMFNIKMLDSSGQLKSTYDILKDLSGAWGGMTLAQQSYMAELVAGKHQINNFLALMNNFDVAIDATSTALNSQGSAAEENAKKLDSISGKIQAFKSSFQSLSTSLIDSGLVKVIVELGTVLIRLVDTGLGRFAIQTGVLVLSISALTGAFNKIKALIQKNYVELTKYTVALGANTVAVNVNNAAMKESIALSSSGGFALQKTASAASNVTGIIGTLSGALSKANVVMLVISIALPLIISLFNKISEHAEKMKHRAENLYKEAKEGAKQAISDLEEIKTQLEDITKQIEELEAKDFRSDIEEKTLKSLKSQNRELLIKQGIAKRIADEAEREAKSKANTYYGSKFFTTPKQPSLVSGRQEINTTTPGGGTLGYRDEGALGVKTETSPVSESEKIIKQVDALKKLIEAKEKLEAKTAQGIALKKSEEEKYEKTTEKINKQKSALTSILNILSVAVGDTSGYTKDKLTSLRDYILNVTDPEVVKTVGEVGDVASKAIDTIGERLSGLSKKYELITSAVAEFNKNGSLSAETFINLQDNDLLQYLDFTGGKLKANTKSLEDMANAAKDAAIGELQLAMAEDLANLAAGRTGKLSETASSAIKVLGNETTIAGDKALKSSSKLIAFAAAAEKAREGASGKKDSSGKNIEKEINAIVSAYEKSAKTISSISIKSGSSGSKSSGSSGSSKAEKEWWETELEKLKEQFKYSDITVTAYISGLEGILSKLGKGTDAWKKINDELQKQRLSKVEDDYKRGIISLDQYINKLKDLIKVYNKGTEAWNDLADKIKKAQEELLGKRKTDYDKAHKAAMKIIDDEIQKINDSRTAIEKRYENEIELKKKSNDETDRAIELAKLEEALENARNQRSKRVWVEGFGWQWQQDQQAIKDAEEALAVFQGSEEIRLLEEARDAELLILDEKIDNWKDYQKTWSDITSEFDDKQNALMLSQQFGANFESEILQQRLSALEIFKNKYIGLQNEILATSNRLADSFVPVVSAPAQSAASGSGGASSAYTVKKGDTLSSIGSKFGIAWKKIYEANKAIIGNNPNLIRVGQQLSIPSYAEGIKSGVIDYTGLAMLHGTPDKPEYLLNNEQMRRLVFSLSTQPSLATGKEGKVYHYSFDKLVLPNVTNGSEFIRQLNSLADTSNTQ